MSTACEREGKSSGSGLSMCECAYVCVCKRFECVHKNIKLSVSFELLAQTTPPA